MSILYAFLIIAGLGAILGIGLAIADKKLSQEKSDKLSKLQEIMPGANCGGCGFAGCSAYAEAVYYGKAQPGLCSPGGKELAFKMGEILGLTVEGFEKQVAYVFCNGNCENTIKVYDYIGLKDCNSASILFKGDKGCKSGCLGFGSCMDVCENEAISRGTNGALSVNPDLCIGCGKCTKVCPNGVIRLIPYSAPYVVACNSHEKGPEVKKVCEAGCIGCKICEVKFPDAGFKVDNFLAVADYKVPSELQAPAAAACPRKIIKGRQ